MTERNEDHIAEVGKKVGESAGPGATEEQKEKGPPKKNPYCDKPKCQALWTEAQNMFDELAVAIRAGRNLGG